MRENSATLPTSTVQYHWDDDVPPPWNPWAYLRRHHPDVEIVTEYRLPEHVMGLTLYHHRVILLCRYMNQNELRSTLAHEIAHIERGPVPVRDAMARDEERCVDRIASRRLVRITDLARIALRHPGGDAACWASNLWVDVPMLQCRLRELDAVERAKLDVLGVDVDALHRANDLSEVAS